MGIEVHAIYASHRPVVIQDKTVFFDPGYDLRLAAAHIAEDHRTVQAGKHGLVQSIEQRGLKGYSGAPQGSADQGSGGDPVGIVVGDHPHALAMQYRPGNGLSSFIQPLHEMRISAVSGE
jgi:hypothetical protein